MHKPNKRLEPHNAAQTATFEKLLFTIIFKKQIGLDTFKAKNKLHT